MGMAAAAIMGAIAVVVGAGNATKKDKLALLDYVLKAQTALVVNLPEGGEPMTDPFASRKEHEEVEKALIKWGRHRLAADASTADLLIRVRAGKMKIANPTVNGGPVDSRPWTVETTDDAIRAGFRKAPSGCNEAAGALGTNGTGGSTTDKRPTAAEAGRGRYAQSVSGESTVSGG